ncbi:MAG: hypothetical protein BJ554DRAFT_8028 [Olpidium bornovanus]|uniref:Uncharacterized protein n=1 Tax=Olpidium bornovanus TaxID=278681 RepID=A0A8H7ZUP5_9FUNG|nr:MAG: hypothetical protein BJ554DRAFT_8028 [Olpidium bornovanus]
MRWVWQLLRRPASAGFSAHRRRAICASPTNARPRHKPASCKGGGGGGGEGLASLAPSASQPPLKKKPLTVLKEFGSAAARLTRQPDGGLVPARTGQRRLVRGTSRLSCAARDEHLDERPPRKKRPRLGRRIITRLRGRAGGQREKRAGGLMSAAWETVKRRLSASPKTFRLFGFEEDHQPIQLQLDDVQAVFEDGKWHQVTDLIERNRALQDENTLLRFKLQVLLEQVRT